MNPLLVAQGLVKVLETGIEYREESFVEFTEAQYASWHRQGNPTATHMYRVVHFEPTMLADRKLELTVVTEEEKVSLIAATQIVYYHCETAGGRTFRSFAEPVNFMAQRAPPGLLPPNWRPFGEPAGDAD